MYQYMPSKLFNIGLRLLHKCRIEQYTSSKLIKFDVPIQYALLYDY